MVPTNIFVYKKPNKVRHVREKHALNVIIAKYIDLRK
jgi:hypothetical protein